MTTDNNIEADRSCCPLKQRFEKCQSEANWQLYEEIQKLEKHKLFSNYVLTEEQRSEGNDLECILEVMNSMLDEIILTDLLYLPDERLSKLIVHAFYSSPGLVPLWSKSSFHFFDGLLVLYILNEMHNAFNETHEYHHAKKYKESYEEMERFLLMLLDGCYIQDEVKAMRALEINYHCLVEKHSHSDEHCKKLTLLDLALKANCENFLGHNCCRRLVSNRWTPGFRAANYKLLISFLFFFPIFFLIDFRTGNEVKSAFSAPKKKKQPRPGFCTMLFSEYPSRVFRFYSSPCSKFSLHMVLYFWYIMLFAYVLVTESRSSIADSHFHWFREETLLFIWQISMFLEMFYRLGFCTRRIFTHFADFMQNLTSITGMCLFLLAYVFSSNEFVEVSCRLAGYFSLYVSFIMTTIRSMRIFSADSFFGAVVLMIRKMAQTLWSFLVIFAIFWFAYAVTTISLSGESPSLQTLPWHMFSNGAFEIFGELNDEQKSGYLAHCQSALDGRSNVTLREAFSCKFRTSMIPVVLFVYVFVVSILLVNLVIAFFTNTYDEIRSSSQLHYRYKMYERLLEYEKKPWLPHPLAIFYYIPKITYKCLKRIRSLLQKHSQKFRLRRIPRKSASVPCELGNTKNVDNVATEENHSNWDNIDVYGGAPPSPTSSSPPTLLSSVVSPPIIRMALPDNRRLRMAFARRPSGELARIEMNREEESDEDSEQMVLPDEEEQETIDYVKERLDAMVRKDPRSTGQQASSRPPTIRLHGQPSARTQISKITKQMIELKKELRQIKESLNGQPRNEEDDAQPKYSDVHFD